MTKKELLKETLKAITDAFGKTDPEKLAAYLVDHEARFRKIERWINLWETIDTGWFDDKHDLK